MPRLSILIPATADERPLEQTMGSVLRNRPRDCEVIVSHAQTYADPYQLSGEIRFVSAPPQTTTVGLMNAGLAVASGRCVHILAPGCEVQESWIEPALEQFRDERVACIALPVTGEPQQRAQAGWRFTRSGRRQPLWCDETAGDSSFGETSNGETLAPLSKAAVFRTAALRHVGGFDEQLSAEWAMIDAAALLQAQGGQMRIDNGCPIVSEQAAGLEEGSSFRWGREAEWVFWRVAEGQSRLSALLRHGAMVMATAIQSVGSPQTAMQLVGRIAGVMTASSSTRRRLSLIKRPEGDEPEATTNERLRVNEASSASLAWRADSAHAARDSRTNRRVMIR